MRRWSTSPTTSSHACGPSGTIKRAEGEKLYLRSDLDFTGATVTDTRAVVKALDTELDARA